MMLLVLTMPVSMAASISGYGFGQDEIPPVVRTQDDITISAEVSGFGTPTTNNVFLNTLTGRIPFEECNANVCSIAIPGESIQAPKSYEIQLIAGPERKSTTVTVIPDRTGARIQSVIASNRPVSPQGNIQLSVTASDSACRQASCQNKCSGIKTIGIYEGNSLKKEIELFSNECTVEISEVIAVSELTSNSGITTFNVRATDMFDNPFANTKSFAINIDDTAPTLPETEFFLQENGVDIVGYNTPISVLFGFNIVEPFTFVNADLSELNPSLSNVVSFNCDQFTCTKQITFTTDESDGEKSFSVDITLIDELGNSETYTRDKEIIIDTTGPTFRNANADTPEVDGAFAFGPNTNLTVDVEDRGVGISTGNIYLDMSELSSSASQVKARSCTEDECVFNGIVTSTNGVKTLRASTSSRDNLGNHLTEPYSFTVYADSIAPVVVDIPFADFTTVSRAFESFSPVEQEEIEQFSAGTLSRLGSNSGSGSSGSLGSTADRDGNGIADDEEQLTGVPTVGDTFSVSVELIEYSNVFAYADFSAYTEDDFSIGTCTGGKEVRNWKAALPDGTQQTVRTDAGETSAITCTFEIEVTKTGTIIAQQANLYFVDPAGNTAISTLDLPPVYGLVDASEANYWDHTIDCSPNALDRSAGAIIEQQMYCQIELNQSGPGQTILDVNINGCSDDHNVIKEAYLGNTQSRYPYLQLTFNTDEFSMNNINVSCAISITSRIGEYEITQVPEVENINIQVPLFNNPIDTPDEAVIDEIEEIKATYAEGMFKTLGTIDTFLKVAQSLCRLSGTFTKVTSAMSVISRSTPEPAGTPTRVGNTYLLQASTKQKGLLQKFCNFANCRASKEVDGKTVETAGGLLGGQWSDTLFSKLDFGGIVEDKFSCLGGDCRKGDASQYMDVKNNYILSIATMCIPGIISNMQKYRQIQCWYGHCLQDIAVEAGLPATACQTQKSYMSCKFFVTPMFKAFPLVSFIDNVVGNVKNILKDPFVAMGFLLNKYCAGKAQDPSGWDECHITDIVNVATDAFADVQSLIHSFKGEGADYCGDLMDSPRSSRSSSRSGSSGGTISR